MIVVDFNQIMISNIVMQLGKTSESAHLEEGMIRHLVLNSLRSYRVKFRGGYGEMIIACDNRNYWRKQAFPYYKASRKKHQEKSILDWKQVFTYMDTIKAEVKAFLPYRVLDVDGAEADDVIATMVHYLNHESFMGNTEPVLILSGDHDFIQLQTDPMVTQFDPIHKKWLKDSNPKRYLMEHVLRGDVGDGIPNVLSDDDTFVTDKRQKPLSKKRMDAIIATFEFRAGARPVEKVDLVGDTYKNWVRNKNLIDLAMVPVDLQVRIWKSYQEQSGKGREKLLQYFMLKGLRNLTQSISDF